MGLSEKSYNAKAMCMLICAKHVLALKKPNWQNNKIMYRVRKTHIKARRDAWFCYMSHDLITTTIFHIDRLLSQVN